MDSTPASSIQQNQEEAAPAAAAPRVIYRGKAGKMMEVEQPIPADHAADANGLVGEHEYGGEDYYEDGMDMDSLPVTQEDAWAVIR